MTDRREELAEPIPNPQSKVRVKASGQKYHRDYRKYGICDCQFRPEGDESISLLRKEAEKFGYEPCQMCFEDGDSDD